MTDHAEVEKVGEKGADKGKKRMTIREQGNDMLLQREEKEEEEDDEVIQWVTHVLVRIFNDVLPITR